MAAKQANFKQDITAQMRSKHNRHTYTYKCRHVALWHDILQFGRLRKYWRRQCSVYDTQAKTKNQRNTYNIATTATSSVGEIRTHRCHRSLLRPIRLHRFCKVFCFHLLVSFVLLLLTDLTFVTFFWASICNRVAHLPTLVCVC